MNSLEGKVAGVRITSSTGAVGASSFIEIRGSASLTVIISHFILLMEFQ